MFSKTTEYALRAVIYIAKYGSAEHKLGLETISKAIDSPPSFTAKVLQKLTKDDGFISSVTGPRGGFFVKPESMELSMMEVLTLLNEESVITKCVLGLQECSETDPCPMHHEYKKIKPQLLKMFEKKTIQDLVNEIGNATIKFKIAKFDTTSRDG